MEDQDLKRIQQALDTFLQEVEAAKKGYMVSADEVMAKIRERKMQEIKKDLGVGL